MSRLRQSTDVSHAERWARINQVMKELYLGAEADRRISTLSGGERLRCAIASEVLSDPPMLFLDEPSTGLDPGMSREVNRLLRESAPSRAATVLVTHELRELHFYDQVLVLARGGRPVFYGATSAFLRSLDNRGRDVAEYFADLRWADWVPATPFGSKSDDDSSLPSPRMPLAQAHEAIPMTTRVTRAVRVWRRDFSVIFQRSFELAFSGRMRPAIMLLAVPSLLGILVAIQVPRDHDW